MGEIRAPNEQCIACGAGLPVATERRRTNDIIVYECKRCGTNIVTGLVSSDGTPAESGPVHVPGSVKNGGSVAASTEWATWEGWWSNIAFVVAIHGRLIAGSKELLSFVEQLEARHDDST